MSKLPSALQRYLKSRRRPAAYLTFSPTGEEPLRGTKLAGRPCLSPVEAWPACPVCSQPLHHLFQLDLSDLEPQNVNRLSFFYCLDCAPESSRQPGWSILKRSDCPTALSDLPLPVVPPQEDQPGPLILLHTRAQVATARYGYDLPSATADPQMRRRLRPGGHPNDRASAALGASQVVTYGLRNLESGEVTEQRLYITPGTDPARLFQNLPPYLALESMHVSALEAGEDYTDAYCDLLGDIRGSKGWPVVSKLGGWLECEQEPRFRRCRCGKSLHHLATIKTTNETPFVIGDVGALYLLSCGSSQCDLIWWMDHS